MKIGQFLQVSSRFWLPARDVLATQVMSSLLIFCARQVPRLAIISLFVLYQFSAQAATYNAASTAYADVLAAIKSTHNGDTVNIPAGTSTWTSSITITNGITINGAGTNSTKLINAQSSSSYQSPIFAIAPTRDVAITIQNIWFEEGGKSTAIQGPVSPSVVPTQVRITQCVIHGFWFGIMSQDMFGVVDHCLLWNNRGFSRVSGFYYASLLCQLPIPPWSWNSPYTWCYENNNFVWDSQTAYAGNSYMFGDTEGPAAYTIRYNTFTVTDTSDFIEGFDMHGNGNFYYSTWNGGVSTLGIQIYGNTFNVSSTGMELCDIRGGYGSLVYSNSISSSGGYMQIRTDPTGSLAPQNTYFWANTSKGSLITPSPSEGVVLGVNYFNSMPVGFSQLPYPHPLVSGSSGQQALVPPSGLHVVSATGP